MKTTRETNNPIAYSLKQLKYHDLIRLDGFEVNLRFQVASVEIFERYHKTFEIGNRLSGFYGL